MGIPEYQKGVKHLCDNGISRVPNKYILPISDRPFPQKGDATPGNTDSKLKLPVIDFAELQGPGRSQVLDSLAKACEDYGFFQLVNHGVTSDVIKGMINASKMFFEMPFEEREKYMSSNMYAPVRYGTSLNQSKDGVFCWRDFLKLVCHPLKEVLPHWPSSPSEFSEMAIRYSTETRHLFFRVIEAILESLGTHTTEMQVEEAIRVDNEMLNEFEDGTQLMVVNCYPSCPEPDLTLGMPPHSDYGFLTLLLQDDVAGLQIQHRGKWVTVEPIPNSFVINVGDHLEIFSNGKYKSVLHRVLVNSAKSRISVASLHSLPYSRVVRPWPKLVDDANPKRYKDTDFATFLKYITSCEPKQKNFLESRKIDLQAVE